MTTTQKHILIEDIKDNIVYLKDNGSAIILQTQALNFGLLSEEEQMAIIFSFGQLLNSLSFSIQIVIRSKRLDISSYLTILDKALNLQTNQLLAKLMMDYRQFIQTTIKEQEVLDKNFFIIIPLSFLEGSAKKAKIILEPRRDQLIRQLNRVGLKATQLDNKKLTEVLFDIYNPSQKEFSNFVSTAPLNLYQKPEQAAPEPQPSLPEVKQSVIPIIQTRNSKTHPFVVEELMDSI